MATGDLKNNLRKLCSDLKKMRVPPHLFCADELASGNSFVFLSIFDYLLQWRSPALSHLINNKGLKPASLDGNKTKFLEGVYLIFREIFSWKPPLTTTQFMSNGFLERKVIMCSEVLKLVNQKDQELEPKISRKPILDVSHSGLKLVFKIPKTPKGRIENTEKDCKVSINSISGGQIPKESLSNSHFEASNTRLDTFGKQPREDPFPKLLFPENRETTKTKSLDNSVHHQPANVNSNSKNPLSEDWDKFQCSILEKIVELETRLSVSEKKIAYLEKQGCPSETNDSQIQNNVGDGDPNIILSI